MPTQHANPRGRGSNAILAAKFEAAYGVVPAAGGWFKLPFVNFNLGEEQPLIEDDLLGTGREGLDPTPGPIDNDGDITVPVDFRAFGHWLALLLGNPEVAAPRGAASAKLTLLAQPAPDSTITFNGTMFTAKASGATGSVQFNIGTDLTATVAALQAKLTAHTAPGLIVASYVASGAVLTVTYTTLGLAGNAYTLAQGAGFGMKIPGATLAGGTIKHSYASGVVGLPSLSLEAQHPEIPRFNTNYGIRANTMRIAMQRTGLLNAVLGLIARGTNQNGASVAGALADIEIDRFQQATGKIVKDGVTLASITNANIAISNGLEKVETIQPDQRIEDVDPGKFMATGGLTSLWRDTVMDDASIAREAVGLELGWTSGNFGLTFKVPRVFLPRPKHSIQGPQGIQREFQWQASGEGTAPMLTVELVNDVATYV